MQVKQCGGSSRVVDKLLLVGFLREAVQGAGEGQLVERRERVGCATPLSPARRMSP